MPIRALEVLPTVIHVNDEWPNEWTKEWMNGTLISQTLIKNVKNKMLRKYEAAFEVFLFSVFAGLRFSKLGSDGCFGLDELLRSFWEQKTKREEPSQLRTKPPIYRTVTNLSACAEEPWWHSVRTRLLLQCSILCFWPGYNSHPSAWAAELNGISYL